MEDLVSVIMPVFNSSKTLAQSIDSILVQSYSNFEILIVDDFSVDDSWRIISDYMKMDSRVIGIKLSKNVGAAQSRNIGIDKATGRFIAFLDADDYWLPNKLERQIEFAIKKKAAISHTSYKWIDSQGKELSKIVVAKPRKMPCSTTPGKSFNTVFNAITSWLLSKVISNTRLPCELTAKPSPAALGLNWPFAPIVCK